MTKVSGPSTETRLVAIKKLNNDKQIVYGEVYAPYVLDTHSEMMTPDDVETMAHRYLKLALSSTIDTMHDNKSNGSYPVESFIARSGDPDYAEGAWVLGVKIEDYDIWQDIKSGVINGFSFEAMVKKVPAEVEIEYDPEVVGVTAEADDHTHMYYVQVDDDGKVIRGMTSTDKGHRHMITRGTATEETDNHKHRYFK